MPTVKRIVCLANSTMTGGRCIAGKEVAPDWLPNKQIATDWLPGTWVRPVNQKNTGLTLSERKQLCGSNPKVLEIIDIPLLDALPKGHQQENWLIDPKRSGQKILDAPRSCLHNLVDPMKPLWASGDSPEYGPNERVRFAEPQETPPLLLDEHPQDSLQLIRVASLKISVSEEPGDKVRGQFKHAGICYRLSVTDPECKKEYQKKPAGEYTVGERFLTISLGKPYGKYCYKIIAAVIYPE